MENPNSWTCSECNAVNERTQELELDTCDGCGRELETITVTGTLALKILAIVILALAIIVVAVFRWFHPTV